MRRIYDSNALRRDDDPQTPTTTDSSARIQALRWVNSTSLSRHLLPTWLCYRALSITVTTPRTEYPAGTPVPFTVTMKNSLPVPVTIHTNSPVLWMWDISGVSEASHVSLRTPPEESGAFVFDRGERKQFHKQWDQLFRVSEREWEPADPGTYTIGAGLNVSDADQKGLYGETTVQIHPA